ncbi:MAG: hypothetical protein ACJ701_06350 [Nitrososphaera sp.]
MPRDIPKDEIEKLRQLQDPEGSKKKTTEKSERMTKASALDLTKADSPSTGIIDIVDNPDVAVWSKGIIKKTNTPADKVQEPHHIKSTTTYMEYREGEEKQSDLQQIVDPANKEDVAKAISLGTSLTDKATGFVQRSKKTTSSQG